MANKSITKGNVTITTKNKEILAKFLCLHKEYGTRNGYEMTIFEIPETIEEIIEYVLNNDTFNFTISGRWSFDEDLDWFMDCLTEFSENKTDEIQTIQIELQKEIIDAKFEYVNMESGRNFIIEEVAHIIHDGSKIDNVELEIETAYSVGPLPIPYLLKYKMGIDNLISVNHLLEDNDYIDKNYPKLIPYKEKIKKELKEVLHNNLIYFSMEELLKEHKKDNYFLKEMLELITK